MYILFKYPKFGIENKMDVFGRISKMTDGAHSRFPLENFLDEDYLADIGEAYWWFSQIETKFKNTIRMYFEENHDLPKGKLDSVEFRDSYGDKLSTRLDALFDIGLPNLEDIKLDHVSELKLMRDIYSRSMDLRNCIFHASPCLLEKENAVLIRKWVKTNRLAYLGPDDAGKPLLLNRDFFARACTVLRDNYHEMCGLEYELIGSSSTFEKYSSKLVSKSYDKLLNGDPSRNKPKGK